MAFLKTSSRGSGGFRGSLVTKRTENDMVLTTPALGTPSAGVVTNLSGVLPSGVTGGSGITALGTVASGNLEHADIVYPTGHIVKTQQYKTTTGQECNGTSEAVYTPLGNPIAFTKVLGATDSSLFFHMEWKCFDSAGAVGIMMSVRLRGGTDTTGTEYGEYTEYDLFHSNSSPHRTGRQTMHPNTGFTAASLAAGTQNFVVTCSRTGYSEPQSVSACALTIFEVIV